jgi:hypothetical protein
MGSLARALISFVAMGLAVGCQQVEDSRPRPRFTIDPVLGFSTPEDSAPLEGALLCQIGTDNCARSDPLGVVSIELPIGETAATLTIDRYLSYLFPLVMAEAQKRSTPFGIESDELAAQQYDHVGSPYPMESQGAVALRANPITVEGATFELLDAPGAKQFYLDEEGWWDPDGEGTTVPHGWGGFTEVNPSDELHAEVGGTVSGCTVATGWPGDSGNTVRFPVREGFVTWVRWNCR